MLAEISSPNRATGAPLRAGWQARLSLGYRRREGCTILAHRSHQGPLRIQRPFYPEGEAVCHSIVLHPPAGIAGGDELTLEVDVGVAAHALLTTPGAGKWYRSAGATGSFTQRIAVGAGGICEYLPQESIVFDAARGRSVLEADLAGDAVLIASEILCFGRTASGERFARGDFALTTRIRRDGRSLWLERGRLRGDDPLLAALPGLGGATVCGTLLAVAPGTDAGLRDACREIPVAVGEGGVTLLPGVLIARYLGPGAEPARNWFAALWAVLRPALAGRPAQLPRIWNT